MTLRSPLIPLVLLGLIFAYAVFWRGAVLPESWSQCALALAALVIFYPLLTPKSELAPPLTRGLKWLLILLPVYVVFQLTPLPLSSVRILSPAKARLIEALAPIMPGISYAPLAVRPSVTLMHLLRIAGYLMVFLLARQIAWRLSARAWICVMPIVAVAVCEALLAVVQYRHLTPSAAFTTGTYIDRNHFAGMLEMAFPFALMRLVSSLRGADSAWLSSLIPAAKIGLPLVAAGLILFGIASSLSRMGFAAALLAILLIGAWLIGGSELGLRLRGRSRWAAAAGLAALVLVCLLFLSPSRLTARFYEFAAPETAAIDRRMIWRQTFRVIADYPFFGCGLGGYQFTYLKYKTEMPLWTTDFAHNDYLQLLAELGIAGALIAGALLLSVLIAIIRSLSPRHSPQIRSLALACGASLAAILLHSLVDFNLYIPANAMELAWISGVAVALPAIESGS